MGSKNCPETPRQRMISMMYLVLTALLALNVSVDILNSFIIVNDSMEETNRIFSAKVDANYANFDAAYANSKDKVERNYQKAQEAKKYTAELIQFIESIRAELISIVEGIPLEEAKKYPSAEFSTRELKKKDNYDTPTRYLIGEKHGGTGGKASELKKKIMDFKQNMINLLDEKSRDKVTIGLKVEEDVKAADGEKMNWEMGTFYHTILIADVTILNKLILEIKNVESDIVSQLYADVSAEDFKFNKISAKVVPKSNFIITGGEFEAEIFVAAYDTLTTPEVIIGSGVDTVNMKVLGNARTLEGEKGSVIYKATGVGSGVQQYGGLINVTVPGGGIKSYPFKGEYTVAPPTATVSADKMNVFYIGVDNPVSISVPGVANDKVKPQTTNCRLTSSGAGKYTCRVESGNEAIIKVMAELDGQTRSMGDFKFRVRRVPDPVPYIANVREGNIPKGNLVANPIIIPRMENFEFDLNFEIVSYTFLITQPGGDVIEKSGTGGKLTQEMVTYINNARRGTRCFIENIRAKGPDGTRSVAPISLRII